MKIKITTASLLVMLIIVSVFNIVWNIHDSYFDNIEVLPQGEFLYSSLSPDGETTVSVYKVNVPTGTAIRGAVVNIDEQGQKQEKNIFWQLGTDNALVGWVSNSTVSINDQTIDVTGNSVYDSRYDFAETENLD